MGLSPDFKCEGFADLELNPITGRNGYIPLRVSGVRGPGRFNYHKMAFLFGVGFVFNAFGNHIHLSLPQIDLSVPQIDRHITTHDDEHLVGLGVAVPDELAFDLG